MLQSTRDEIPMLSSAVLQARAAMLEREAAEEQARADTARLCAEAGRQHIGPRSYAELARVRQGMADARRADAQVYRQALARRGADHG